MVPIFLGEFLLEKEAITPSQLEKALAKQRESKVKRLGEIFLELGLISPRQREG